MSMIRFGENLLMNLANYENVKTPNIKIRRNKHSLTSDINSYYLPGVGRFALKSKHLLST